MRTAYVYARFSSDNQREESIDAQLRAIKEYCKTEDITILKEFTDEAVSARTDKRPAFQEMFSLIKEAPADYIVVHKLDRFARNRYDAAFYRKKLTDAGMRLISVLEKLDDSPEAIILEGLLESMNEYYSANLAREVRKGQLENVYKGRRNGGVPPIGYDSVDQKLVPNIDAERVKKAFEMYAALKPFKEISEATGISKKTISNMVRKEAYIGTIVYGDEKYENAHEPLIDRLTWEEAQKRAHNASQNAMNRAKSPYILSGLISCGVCGKKMYGTAYRKEYKYYTCRTKGCKMYDSAKLEKEVIDSMAEMLAPTDELREHLFEVLAKKEEDAQKIERIEKLRADTEKRISSLLVAVQYAQNEGDVKKLMNEVNRLRENMPEVPKVRPNVTREQVNLFCDRYFDLKSKDREEQRVILRRALTGVEVFSDKIVLHTTLDDSANIPVYKKIPSPKGGKGG